MDSGSLSSDKDREEKKMENKGKNTFASFSLSAAPAGGPVWPSFLMDSKESEKKYKINITEIQK